MTNTNSAMTQDINAEGSARGIAAEEITMPIDHTDRIKSAFDDALAALIAGLNQQYEDETGALDAERMGLVEEHTSIGEAAEHLRALLPAKERVAQAEADRLMVSGQREEAQAKIAEMEQARHAPEAMKERQRAISSRLEEIAREERTIAREIFERWFTEVQPIVRAGESGLFLVLLEGLEKSSYEYQARTDTGGRGSEQGGPYQSPLVRPSRFTALTSDERSVEWRASQKWYGGGLR